MRAFDVIIPHCNAPGVDPLAAACLRSVRQCSRDYRVVWVQNGGEIPEEIRRELGQCEEALVVRNETNLGFVRATNQGLRGGAPYPVMLNNDTRVPPGWLEKLRRPLLDESVGLAGPLTTAIDSWQGRVRPRANPWTVPDEYNLAFFCAMTRRDVVERVGLLDEGFGMGLGDDDDYCARVRAAGYRLALVTDLVVYHQHRATFRALFARQEIREMQSRAGRRLAEKSAARRASENNATKIRRQ